ncbi:major facilitator superfamily domain-containing protein [Microdochium trichocladiopsis]|uniref:Major facilitator superfamily domain-containing protein n=1 Tax=Microdochium trichocladiopsis TaxID=1682393 RepID=A0A9P8XTS5_9PEZI|nr:major facilitator superfamily domain-containing protein [Microdochium trichocladiopsis]KAH7017979.1 major facilitator superfamily domain-containing protein [Microdochium trichocladiopsis]
MTAHNTVDAKGRSSDDLARVEEAELKGEQIGQPGLATALEIQGRFDSLRDLTPEQMDALNKRVVKKVDWRLMPMITLMFLLNYLDRVNVSNARLAGFQTDLGMSDTVWSAGISTFYVGYLVGQLPGNMILAKTKPNWFLSLIMLLWSAGTLCMAALTSGAGFAVCRFFIGFTEAPFFPGITLMTSSWYTKEESPLRMAIWHAGNTASNILSGFLAAGILENMQGVVGLKAWQWFFLIEGAVSVIVAIVAYFILPGWPEDSGFLDDQERDMAKYRMLVSNGGIDETQVGAWAGLKMAAKDPFTWIFCLMHFALITAQSFKDFMPSIMETFHFNKLTTYLVQAPPYAIAYAAACALAWSSGRFQESFWHVVIPIILGGAGCGILIGTLNVGARYFGLCLLVAGTYNGLNLQLSWETTVVPAPRSKKAALVAIANCISQTSHWFTPYFFPRSQVPYYRLGGSIILVGVVLVVVSAVLTKWRATVLNKKLDEQEGWSPTSGNERGWRYVS